MDIDRLLEETEERNALVPVLKPRVFQSVLNQPTLLSLNSKMALQTGSSTGFSTLDFTLSRALLQVQSLQLMNANIPVPTTNIPDTALVFWYYRTSVYSGAVPNPNNLYMVRLLPSTYKPEYFNGAYGVNRTFVSYQDVANELVLACANDIGFTNSTTTYEDLFFDLVVPFLPGEISISYNATLNRFQMTGTNATTQLAYKTYSSGTTYAQGDVVKSGSGINAYISLQNANTGNSLSSSAWWKRVYVDVVADWSAATPYRTGRYVAYNNVLYISIANTIGDQPDTSATDWEVVSEEGQVNYRYLITGYADPNVAWKQSARYMQWNPYALYETGNVVEWNGEYWSAIYQTIGIEPFDTTDAQAWVSTRQYLVGDVVFWNGNFYRANQNNLNATPSMFSSVWDLQAWQSSLVAPLIVGLYETTKECDLVETQSNGGILAPFPTGVAGQPVVPKPVRLLNSVLGFTWNGLMTPSQLQNIAPIDFNTLIETTQTDLFNRVRPIPPYMIPEPTLTSVLDASSTGSQTYTADGYACLVYSSIVNLYLSCIGSSTQDVLFDNNLLATCSISAGNLGVVFFSPTINNPVRLRQSDLTNFTIEMRDEVGDPYVLGNNAVLSFVLKLTYKEEESEKTSVV